MSERIVGIKIMASPFPSGIALIPSVPIPSTEAERIFAAEQSSKASVLLKKTSPGQVVLFRHLAANSPGGIWIVKTARWIDTIMRATKGFSEESMEQLYAFDWD